MNLTLRNLHPSRRPPLPSRWRKVIRDLVRVLEKAASQDSAIKSPPPSDLSVAWMSDPQIADANWQFLRHQGPTDVITFDYGDGNAEILVSLDTAAAEARRRGGKLEDEIRLYLAHGLLHLVGFRDKSSAQRSIMRRREKWLLGKAVS